MLGSWFHPIYLFVLVPLLVFVGFLGGIIFLGFELKYSGRYSWTWDRRQKIIRTKKLLLSGLQILFVVLVAGIEVLIHSTHVHRNMAVFGWHLLFDAICVTCFLFARYKYTGLVNPRLHGLYVWGCLSSLLVSVILGLWLMLQH